MRDGRLSYGKLVGIAIREKSRATMVELDQVEISTETGVAGDFRGKPGKRQVTVMSIEQWREACDELGKEIPWTTRRANLLVEGLSLADTNTLTLQIGDVVLKISGETEPCGRMDEQVAGLKQALMPEWRGGVCCRVVHGGRIRPGMEVILVDN